MSHANARNRASPVLASVSALALAAAAAFPAADAHAQWKPQRPVEFVIQTSPGGGSDQYARMWIGIIEKRNLSPVPIIPVNKPGGAGAVTLAYLLSKKGDPHFITPTLNSVVTTPLLQKIPVMYPSTELTPLAMMATDPFLLVVNKEVFKNWEEFHKACKERTLTAVGTGRQQEDEIQIFMFQRAAGCQPFRYVPAAGGGDVATQVAGKHADFNVNQPAEFLPHYPDRLIPILAFQKTRAPAFADAPTHHEKGLNSQWASLLDLDTGLHQMRGIIGPPDLPPEAVRFWENLFKAVWETPEWQAFLKKTAQVPLYKPAAEYRQYMRAFEDNHVKVMRDVLGWKLRDDLKAR
jgi:tripartite-type tricarboxylate transporter receptor subunit TctC